MIRFFRRNGDNRFSIFLILLESCRIAMSVPCCKFFVLQKDLLFSRSNFGITAVILV